MRTLFSILAFCVSITIAQADGLSRAITPTIPSSISDIFFVDGHNGWIVGNSGMIMHSTDGGATWNAQASGVTNNLQRAFFVNARVGYVGMAGRSSILRTADGGETWERISLPGRIACSVSGVVTKKSGGLIACLRLSF